MIKDKKIKIAGLDNKENLRKTLQSLMPYYPSHRNIHESASKRNLFYEIDQIAMDCFRNLS